MLSGVGKEQLKVIKETAKEALKGQLEDLKKQFREGSDQAPADQTQPSAPGTESAQQAAPAKRPEEKLKEKLKGLLR
jgi:hypothetical protein